MFEENENLVEEETTENVEEQTTEENVQDVQEKSTDNVENTEEKVEKEQEAITFTKEQVDEMIAKKLARKEAKIRREYEKKYGRAETVLKTGLQKDNLEDAVSELENYYEEQGVRIPKTQYSQRDTEILARAEADEIIEAGYDDIVEEVDRLANIGVENMSTSDKVMFQRLAEARMKIEEERDLSSLGISKDSLSEEFKEFAKHLDSKMSLKDNPFSSLTCFNWIITSLLFVIWNSLHHIWNYFLDFMGAIVLEKGLLLWIYLSLWNFI